MQPTNQDYPNSEKKSDQPEPTQPIKIFSGQDSVIESSIEPALPSKNLSSATFDGATPEDKPIAVVKTLSVRGLEYFYMSIALWFGAVGLAWALLSLVNNEMGFKMLSMPVTVLLVSLPVFAFFFIRLKKAELADPSLRFDASKRRLSQITQVVAFITCLVNVITFVYILISAAGGEGNYSLGKAALNMFVILLVAGGLLVYYWFDEHRSFNR